MMQTRLPLVIATAVLTGIGAAWIPAASAQSNLEAPSNQPNSAEQLGIGQQDLKTFAIATREVNQIDADYQPKVDSANTPQERQQIESEAEDKMVEAVQNKGLTVEQYNQIALLAEFDPGVARQIQTYVQEPDL